MRVPYEVGILRVDPGRRLVVGSHWPPLVCAQRLVGAGSLFLHFSPVDLGCLVKRRPPFLCEEQPLVVDSRPLLPHYSITALATRTLPVARIGDSPCLRGTSGVEPGIKQQTSIVPRMWEDVL